MSSQPCPIEHVVVLMFENRSYDNMLGWLYNPENPPPFDRAPPGQSELRGLTGSLAGGDQHNVNPADPAGEPLRVWNGGDGPEAMIKPFPDPGEPFDDMAQQILGLSTVPHWWQDPVAPGPLGPMGGFTVNYRAAGGDPRDIMHAFVPRQVPVTSALARAFAVSDCWFASVPTQTFPNRVCAQCGAPGYLDVLVERVGLLDDTDYILPMIAGGVTLPTLFQRLDEAYPRASPPAWKVYFHDYPLSLLTKYVLDAARSDANVNVAPFDGEDWSDDPWFLGARPSGFFEDIERGQLPRLSFLEPRYCNDFPGANQGLPTNNNHPGVSNLLGGAVSPSNPPIDVTHGERLLARVYNALRERPEIWKKTLLIVTYDEHGGTYDSVPPPAAVRPGDSAPVALNGYTYDTLGGRVPALIISPYAPAGSAARPAFGAPFDHTSIIKTVRECFGLPPGGWLTERDRHAPSVLDCLDFGTFNAGPEAIPLPPAPAPIAHATAARPGSRGAFVSALRRRMAQR